VLSLLRFIVGKNHDKCLRTEVLVKTQKGTSVGLRGLEERAYTSQGLNEDSPELAHLNHSGETQWRQNHWYRQQRKGSRQWQQQPSLLQ
jgi:hypothetical protein